MTDIFIYSDVDVYWIFLVILVISFICFIIIFFSDSRYLGSPRRGLFKDFRISRKKNRKLDLADFRSKSDRSMLMCPGCGYSGVPYREESETYCVKCGMTIYIRGPNLFVRHPSLRERGLE